MNSRNSSHNSVKWINWEFLDLRKREGLVAMHFWNLQIKKLLKLLSAQWMGTWCSINKLNVISSNNLIRTHLNTVTVNGNSFLTRSFSEIKRTLKTKPMNREPLVSLDYLKRKKKREFDSRSWALTMNSKGSRELLMHKERRKRAQHQN